MKVNLQMQTGPQSMDTGLKYPPLPKSSKTTLPQGVVGTLLRLLLCFDKEYEGRKPVKDLLSNPPLLSLAARILESRRPVVQPSKSEIVEETCFILASFLDYVDKKTQTKEEIPADSTLARCLFYRSTLNTRPLIEKLLTLDLDPKDARFLVRAIQNPKWRARTQGVARKCFDPTWRISTESSSHRQRRKRKFVFRRTQTSRVRDCDVQPSQALSVASIHRPYWRFLPAEEYSSSKSSWILSTTDILESRRNRKQTPSQKKDIWSTYCVFGERHWRQSLTRYPMVDWEDVKRKRSELQRQLHWLLFTDVFSRVQRKFNQRVQKLKSPDTIPVLDKPAPTPMYLDRRVSYEMRRMVPTIHWQRYRGMQLRDKYKTENAIAVYWYNSHLRDILATLAELEKTLLRNGVYLPLSEVEEPGPVEIRRLM